MLPQLVYFIRRILGYRDARLDQRAIQKELKDDLALEKELGPFDDEEYFREISPLFHAENIVKPFMVLQGANDPRVLKAESDDIVEAVRERGVPVEYVVFDDEGHGFMKKENRERGYEGILEFLDEYLRPIGADLQG